MTSTHFRPDIDTGLNRTRTLGRAVVTTMLLATAIPNTDVYYGSGPISKDRNPKPRKPWFLHGKPNKY